MPKETSPAGMLVAPAGQARFVPGAQTDRQQPASNPALQNRLRRGLLVTAGTLFVGVGVVGALVPVLPTTPFLLLAAACYVRSSERLYRWLFTNRVFGEYLGRYRDGEGLPLASKILTLTLLWITLGSSALLAVPARSWGLRVLLLGVGVGVTIHILRIRTRRERRGASPVEPRPGSR